MSDRDEIVVIIDRKLSTNCAEALGDNWPYDVAEEILARGYRKPRTITEVVELNALPHRSVVIEKSGGACQKDRLGDWLEPGGSRRFKADRVELPAAVVHIPEES